MTACSTYLLNVLNTSGKSTIQLTRRTPETTSKRTNLHNKSLSWMWSLDSENHLNLLIIHPRNGRLATPMINWVANGFGWSVLCKQSNYCSCHGERHQTWCYIYIYIHGENVCSFVKKTSIHNIVLCFLNFKHPFAFGKKKTLHPLFI